MRFLITALFILLSCNAVFALEPVILYLDEQPDVNALVAATENMTKDERREYFVMQMKTLATTTQTNLLEFLVTEEADGNAANIHSLYVANLIIAHVTPALKQILRTHGDVRHLLDNVNRRSPGSTLNCNNHWNIEHTYVHSSRNHLGYTGNGIVIGIVDSGVDYTHPSLAPNIWQNLDEDFDGDGHTLECGPDWTGCRLDQGDTLSVEENTDADNNGYLNDLIGWNLGEGGQRANFDPYDVDTLAYGIGESHGTHVAGVAAAVSGSEGEMISAAPNAKIMPIRIWNDTEEQKLSSFWEAMQYAFEKKADIINFSTLRETPGDGTTLERAVFRQVTETVIAGGLVVVAAAGNLGDEANEGYTVPRRIHQPADVPDVITIGATDFLDEYAGFSSDGPVEWWHVGSATSGPYYNDCDYITGNPSTGCPKPDFCSPGESNDLDSLYHIISTHKGGGFVSGLSGTSFSAPQVAGIIACLLEANPELMPNDILNILNQTAIDIGVTGWDPYTGHGFVSAIRALVWLEHGFLIENVLEEDITWANAPQLGIIQTNTFVSPKTTFCDSLFILANGYVDVLSGANFIIGKDVTITLKDYYGNGQLTLQDSSHVLGYEGSKILVKSNCLVTDHGANFENFQQLDAGLIIESGGQFISTANDQQISFTNGGFLSLGGTMQLADNANITIGPNSYLEIQPGATFVTSSNATIDIYGELRVADNASASFPENVTVYFHNGAMAKMGAKAEILVEGEIQVDGSSSHVVFTTTNDDPSDPRWNRIKLTDSASDQSTIVNAHIKHCTEGIYAYHCSPRIESCSFEDIDGVHILLDHSDAELIGNTVDGTEVWNKYGIYITNSDPTMFGNEIWGHDYGLFFDSYSTGQLGGLNDPGLNKIYGNERGVMANHSVPIIGAPSPRGLIGGHNCLEDNTIDLYAINYSQIMAVSNYWGLEPVFRHDNTSSYNVSYPLVDCPADERGSQLPALATTSNPATRGDLSRPPSNQRDHTAWWEFAYYHWLNSDPALAVRMLELMVSLFPDSELGQWGLITVAYLHWENNLPGLSTYLTGLLADEDAAPLHPMVHDLLIRAWVEDDDYNSAIAAANMVIQTYPDSEHERHALYSLFNIYFNDLDDRDQAAMIYTILQTDYPNDDLTWLAGLELGLDPSATVLTTPGAFPSTPTTSGNEAAFGLSQNYPNPFNPTTVISFQLPVASRIELSVYNTSGQMVKKLATGNLEPGTHDVIWDGTNDKGQPVGSGIYFYRLKTSNGFEATRSMILLK